MTDFVLPELPPALELETKPVLKQALHAGRALAELKGVSQTIPNQSILINTLPLLEAKDSSAIENIITTHDDLYKEDLFGEFLANAEAKEVNNYAEALKTGFQKIREQGLLTNKLLLEVQACIEKNNAGFRKLPGTELKNLQTGATVYTPPQHAEDVLRLMGNLERVINDDGFMDVDPLVKMAVIHYQLESIHPFYDGNGRTGRILNILYLVNKGLLDLPILYLSRYIIQTKGDYYRLLQGVRDEGGWEAWLLYLLAGVEQTAADTITLIEAIRELMKSYKHQIRAQYKFYSQDLLNNLFCHPYTKIEFLERDLRISRQTASKYLETLSQGGFLRKERIGKVNFYINKPLFELFSGGNG
jgi:Fic family protein